MFDDDTLRRCVARDAGYGAASEIMNGGDRERPMLGDPTLRYLATWFMNDHADAVLAFAGGFLNLYTDWQLDISQVRIAELLSGVTSSPETPHPTYSKGYFPPMSGVSDEAVECLALSMYDAIRTHENLQGA